MIRRLCTAIVFLLIGAVISVLVAWGCTLCRVDPLIVGKLESDSASSKYWQFFPDLEVVKYPKQDAELPRDRSTGVIFALLPICYGGALYRVEDIRGVTATKRFTAPRLMIIEAGWPLRCLRAERTIRTGVNTVLGGYEIAPCKLAPPIMGEPRVLPLRPLWTPLIANSVMYATVPCALWLIQFLLRRGLRKRAGLCVHCGYNLRGAAHTRCPECGVPCELRAVSP